MNSKQSTANRIEPDFPPRHVYAPVERKPVTDRQWPPMRVRETYVEKRCRTRRAADKNFMFALVASAAMLSLTMFALGYYWAAQDAAAIVLGAK